MIQSVNLVKAFEGVIEHWSPKVIGRVNDQYVKIAKVQGQLAWHRHDEDELFQIVRGQLRIQFEGGAETVLEAGEFCVVPRGVLHNPVADEECWVVLVETVTTKHTGDANATDPLDRAATRVTANGWREERECIDPAHASCC